MSRDDQSRHTDGRADHTDSGEVDQRSGNGQPAGEVYDWYRRGMQLLDTGHAAAAAQLLRHAAIAEPNSHSIREGLARAQFDAGQYPAARQEFRSLLEANPDDDYAHFGYGLACWRLGDLGIAAEHLAMAVAMRPTAKHYADALTQVRATLRARG
ncbi:MAG: tetratricopeptide repeat protein [Sporichthyaceae bacterium]|nr:tetratricopeptide repeat protein [Sporichthyaceae bacterium]